MTRGGLRKVCRSFRAWLFSPTPRPPSPANRTQRGGFRAPKRQPAADIAMRAAGSGHDDGYPGGALSHHDAASAQTTTSATAIQPQRHVPNSPLSKRRLELSAHEAVHQALVEALDLRRTVTALAAGRKWPRRPYGAHWRPFRRIRCPTAWTFHKRPSWLRGAKDSLHAEGEAPTNIHALGGPTEPTGGPADPGAQPSRCWVPAPDALAGKERWTLSGALGRGFLFSSSATACVAHRKVGFGSGFT